jgi:hypothetical protein
MTRTSDQRRSGQTIVFMIMILVILVFVVIWNFDLHRILYVKSVSQNGGDAASLMAARWQGITLNLVGDLNIMLAGAVSEGDSEGISAISNIQARLCYVGPMIALMASQQAAKNNGIYSNSGFTEALHEHARIVREIYPYQTSDAGEILFPEPYPGCWADYADMLELIAAEGIAAAPDNARFYTDSTGGHLLLSTDFYEAVAGRNWCWFHNHAPSLLETYDSYRWWPPFPDIPHRSYINSEIYGLSLTRQTTSLDGFGWTAQDMAALSDQRSLSVDASSNSMSTTATWYCYRADTWSQWDAFSIEGAFPFPATGPVKPEYDYAGADAVVRVVTDVGRMTPGTGGTTVTNRLTWTSAAKPFGFLGSHEPPTANAMLVLPAYHRVGLIPLDTASWPSGGAFNLDWRDHIENHLEPYLEKGPAAIPADTCFYCRQLVTWEDPDFRNEGIAWLGEYSWRCTITGGGNGSHRGGGRRRGH